MSTPLGLETKSKRSSSTSDHDRDLEADAQPELLVAPGPIAEERRSGAERIEALYRVFGKGGLSIWALYGSLFLFFYAYSLAGNTVSNYLAFATSHFGEHTVLSTIDTMVYVIGAVGKPFVAQLADITSRPIAYSVSLVLYVLGFVVVAAAQGIGAVAGGQLMYEVGSVGLDLVTDLIVADLSPLEWRGFMTALPSAPYIINAYVSGFITDGLGEDGWRWGYGMFAIMMPMVMAPALIVLFWADVKAKKAHILSFSASNYAARTDKQERKSWLILCRDFCIKIDAFGLILLGFSWSLILLPFTLKSTAADGYKNPSLIAMFAVGGVLLIAFGLYEKWGTNHPILPYRILNKVFILGVIIDAFYFLSGRLRSTYFSSWTYVVTDWSLYEWTIFSNTETVGLCVFGLIAGLIQRYTHRYKWLQVSGLSIRIIGMGLTFYARGSHATNVALAWTQILIALGGAFSVVGTRVSTQASVPHEDLAVVIANLALWTKLAGAIGAAVAGAVWSGTMPTNLSNQLRPLGLSAADIKKIYGSIKTAKSQPANVRAAVIIAYDATVKPLYIAALVLSFVPFIAGLLTTNYYLGKTQNAVDGRVHAIYAAESGETAYVPESGDPRMVGTEAHTAAGVGGVDDGVPEGGARRRD